MLLLFNGCPLDREILISGRTMGTTYHIKVVVPFFKSTSLLTSRIESRLDEINRSMSTYISDSEISRFNAWKHPEKFAVSADFMRVARLSESLYRLSEGAWDGTVKPLVNLWGFGHTGYPRRVPPQSDIREKLDEVGFSYIEISDDGCLKKKRLEISLDFSSVAKGYGVDQIASLIKAQGLADYLVEIGGEVYGAGLKKNKTPWRVGINRPSRDAASDEVYRVVVLRDRALATSGDYRNFFELDGRTYSHIIDPRTGYPVSNGVVSVSVAAPTCAVADGLATALMVMGPEKGLEMVEKMDHVECLIVVRRADGTLEDHYSRGFETLLASVD